jgi:flagellar hook-associated protein FlgK
MSNISLNLGLKALIASQTNLDTIGNNVSNANTPGYSRQTVDVVASPSLTLRGIAIGNGVDVEKVQRTMDDLLYKRIVAQQATLGRASARVDGLSQVEALFGAPGDAGLATTLQGLYASFAQLATNPVDSALKQGAVQSAVDLSTEMNRLAGNLDSTRMDAVQNVRAQVQQVNTLAGEISTLNTEVSKAEGSGLTANDLRDQRDELVKQLGTFIDVQSTEATNGSITVLTAGQLLIGPSRAYAMTATASPAGVIDMRIQGHTAALSPRGGSLAGLLDFARGTVPGYQTQLDAVAKSLIFSANKAHSTGMPSGGALHSITGVYTLQDQDGDGRVTDESLGSAGLPFDVSSGELFVHSVNETTGEVSTRRIAIDPRKTTVGDLADEISKVPHLSAGVDSAGHFTVSADTGFGFDFSRRVDPAPDAQGAFGGAQASIVGTTNGPYSITNGDTLQLTGPGGAFTVTLDSSHFTDPTHVSAEDLANEINTQSAATANGVRAVVAGDGLALQTLTTGSSAALTINGGTLLPTLGFASGTTVQGQAHAVAPQIGGTYGGASNETYTFKPNMDGTIGTTNGLMIDVYDSTGAKVKSLDVGPGYQPGSPLDLAGGLTVSFNLGNVSKTNHDAFVVNAVADSDTSDVLAALGVNVLFTGTKAADMGVRSDIVSDPSQLVTSSIGPTGDASAVQDFMATRTQTQSALGGATIEQGFTNIVDDVGSDVSTANSAQDTEQKLMDSLNARRDQVSGVNSDEELVNMMRYQQSYGAAAQYIQIVNQTMQALLQII